MKVSILANKCGYRIVTEKFNDLEVETGYTSDLLSDVMANALEGSILITIQAHKNSVAVAMQLDLSAVLICNNRKIPEDMQRAAEDAGIAILATSDNQFNASCKIYENLEKIE